MYVLNEFLVIKSLKIVRKLCVSSKISINVNGFHSAVKIHMSKITWLLPSCTSPYLSKSQEMYTEHPVSLRGQEGERRRGPGRSRMGNWGLLKELWLVGSRKVTGYLHAGSLASIVPSSAPVQSEGSGGRYCQEF